MTRIRSSRTGRVQDRRGRGGGGGGGFGFPGLGGGGGGGLGMPMKAGGGILGLLLVAAAIFLPQLLGGSQQQLAGPSVGPDQPAGDATCSTELEQVLCGGVDDVSEYWIGQLPESFGQRYEEADTVFFSQATNTGCGQASAQLGPFYCPADRLVYFDLPFLTQLQQQFDATGDLAAQYIVAHEYGHHVQNLLGISSEVSRLQQQDPDGANRYSVALELQADCFAGAWARDADDRGQLDQGEIAEALNAASAVGDDSIQERTQGRVDPDSFTHGTSEQRVSWFRRGYDTGDPRQCDTFAEL